MEYNDLINELLDLLDKNSDIKKIKTLKLELLNDKKMLSMIENYRENQTVEAKEKLFQNPKYLEYLKSESNIRLLIFDIKNKFKEFNSRMCQHEGH